MALRHHPGEIVVTEIDKAVGVTHPQFQALVDLREEYDAKMDLYRVEENKWRDRAFHLAIMMGVLPVAAGVTQLMPTEQTRQIFTLLISITNVIVVVANVKLDIGERTSDAAMARKGYEKCCSQINLFFCHLRCGDELDAKELLTKIRAVAESIESNLSYPAIPVPKEEEEEEEDLESGRGPMMGTGTFNLAQNLAGQGPGSDVVAMAAGARRFSAAPMPGTSVMPR